MAAYTEDAVIGLGHTPVPTSTKIANRNRNMKLLSIVSPSGETGYWLFDELTAGSSIDSALSILSKYINAGSTGFQIYIKKCDEVVPSEISLDDEDLRYVDVHYSVIHFDLKDGALIKNKDIFKRVVAEATTNLAYRNWFLDRVETQKEEIDKPSAMKKLVEDLNTAIQALS